MNYFESKKYSLDKLQYIGCSHLGTFKKYKPQLFGDLSENEIEKLLLSWTIEQTIAQTIKNNPHPNIVQIYDITNNYIEMEKVDTKYLKPIDIKVLHEAKNHLHNLGITYIDWKHDNIGVDEFGNFKLFDFDCGGTFDIKQPQKWLFEPLSNYNYQNSLKDGYIHPIDIDNYCFMKGLITGWSS